ncbi:hypothetical protein BD779DRAFT_1469316 [Infundibulicybe gibba]|nr:hypothetical protein BD779DRAFT_1469316 [Infundibulicybe gibba]
MTTTGAFETNRPDLIGWVEGEEQMSLELTVVEESFRAIVVSLWLDLKHKESRERRQRRPRSLPQLLVVGQGNSLSMATARDMTSNVSSGRLAIHSPSPQFDKQRWQAPRIVGGKLALDDTRKRKKEGLHNDRIHGHRCAAQEPYCTEAGDGYKVDIVWINPLSNLVELERLVETITAITPEMCLAFS